MIIKRKTQSLVKVGAVEMIPDAELTGARLVAAIDDILLNNEKDNRWQRRPKGKASQMQVIVCIKL